MMTHEVMTSMMTEYDMSHSHIVIHSSHSIFPISDQLCDKIFSEWIDTKYFTIIYAEKFSADDI